MLCISIRKILIYLRQCFHLNIMFSFKYKLPARYRRKVRVDETSLILSKFSKEAALIGQWHVRVWLTCRRRISMQPTLELWGNRNSQLRCSTASMHEKWICTALTCPTRIPTHECYTFVPPLDTKHLINRLIGQWHVRTWVTDVGFLCDRGGIFEQIKQVD